MSKSANSIGKLITLRIGVEQNYDTNYELLIGKIPEFNKDSCSGVNNFQNSYYICNFNNKKFDVFPLPCFLSDLEHVFDFNRDQYIVSKWLNDIDLEKVIYDDNLDYTTTITQEEYKKFVSE